MKLANSASGGSAAEPMAKPLVTALVVLPTASRRHHVRASRGTRRHLGDAGGVVADRAEGVLGDDDAGGGEHAHAGEGDEVERRTACEPPRPPGWRVATRRRRHRPGSAPPTRRPTPCRRGAGEDRGGRAGLGWRRSPSPGRSGRCSTRRGRVPSRRSGRRPRRQTDRGVEVVAVEQPIGHADRAERGEHQATIEPMLIAGRACESWSRPP